MATDWLGRFAPVLRPLAGAALVAAPLTTHAAIATGRAGGAAALLCVVQVGVMATLALRQARGWARVAGAGVALLLLAALAMRFARPGWAGNGGLVAASAASHAVIYLSLLLLFGRSLQAGRTALITGLAARLRGPLSPRIAAYTRTVTKAWCVFFVAQLAASAVLLAAAPERVWSLFVNVLDAPLVVLMFAGEYAVRRWLFRDERHISPVETMRSFARSRAAGPS